MWMAGMIGLRKLVQRDRGREELFDEVVRMEERGRQIDYNGHLREYLREEGFAQAQTEGARIMTMF